MTEAPIETLIAQGTTVEGSVTSTCGITLRGELKGDVFAPSLNVEPSGKVDGSVEVEEFVSHGEVSGRIKAKHIQLGGRVRDKTVISAETMEVKLVEPGGVQVAFGDCEFNVGEPAEIAPTEPE